MDGQLFCHYTAKYGAIECPGCGKNVPVFEPEGEMVVIIPHIGRGKMNCLASGKKIHISYVKSAVWIE